jgi:tetratricopeptide (TPR) repeat protein
VVTTAVNLFLAGDLSRSMSVLVPVALLGMILLVQLRPTQAKRILAAVLMFNLLTPARHVIAGPIIPETITPLHVELPKFLRPTPDQSIIYHGRGMALLRRGKPKSALRSLDVAIRLDPSAAALYWDRGDCLAALGRPEEAVASFDVAVRLDPTRPEPYLHRGRFHRSRGDFAAAARDLSRAIALGALNASDRSDLAREVAELRRVLGDPQRDDQSHN